MNAVRAFFKQELSGWKRWESLTLLVSCLVILALSLYWHDTWMGVTSSITGVAYTVCNGAGRRLAYVFGVVNAVLYAIISFNAGLYGDAALYGLYYLPAMVVGFVLWGKHVDGVRGEVLKRCMTAKQRVALLAACVLATAAGAWLLALVNDAAPVLDAFTTMGSVIGLIVAIGRYAEQWALWTAVNAVEVVMWALRLAQGVPEAGSSLIMWALFLAIGIVMWVRWHRQLVRS